jgi:hypothetical protein
MFKKKGGAGSEPTREKFASQLVDEFRKNGLVGTYHPEDFTLSFLVQGNPARLDLQDFYPNYCEVESAQRGGVLDHIVKLVQRSLTPAPLDRRKAQSLLVPRIVGRASIEQARVQGESVPHQLLGEAVAITLGLDYPELIQGVQQSNLDQWGMTVEQALRFATENLWKRSEEPLKEIAPGVLQSAYGDGNDAARILLQTKLQGLALPGGPVAFIPDTGVLLVTGKNDEDAVGHILKMLTELSGQRQVTLHGFQLRDETRASSLPTEHDYVTTTWERLEFPPDHPHAEALRRLYYQEKILEYAEQRAFLLEHFRSQGDNVRIAECEAVDGKTALAGWTSSQAWLLPEAHQTHDGKEQLTWAQTKERYRLTQTEHWPRLWKYEPT